MGWKNNGSAFALVLCFFVSGCDESGGGDVTDKACALTIGGDMVECNDYVGAGFSKEDVAEICGQETIRTGCPTHGDFAGICKFDVGTPSETHEYWYDWYQGDGMGPAASYCEEELGGVWAWR